MAGDSLRSAASSGDVPRDAKSGYQPSGEGRGAWASAFGAVAVMLGLLLSASHANEWMKQAVISASTPESRQLPPADCPEDELEEEGLSFAECEHLVARVQAYVLAAPPWFGPAQMTLSVIGTFAALLSALAGAALISARDWAPRFAVAVFALLLLIDAAGFIATVNAGPLIRSDYLWPTLVWFTLHLMLLVAGVASLPNAHPTSRTAEAA